MIQNGLISLKTGEFVFNDAKQQQYAYVRENKIQRRNSISVHFILSVSIATEFIVLKMINCIYIHL